MTAERSRTQHGEVSSTKSIHAQCTAVINDRSCKIHESSKKLVVVKVNNKMY